MNEVQSVEVFALMIMMAGVGYKVLFMFLKGKLPTPKERVILLNEIKKRDKALERLSHFVFNDLMQIIETTGADVSVVKEKVGEIEKQIGELNAK